MPAGITGTTPASPCAANRRQLSELTTADARTFYENLHGQLRSRDMVRHVRISAGAILRYAQKKGSAVKNVIALTPYKHSKRKKKRPPMPTLEESRRCS